MKEAHATVTRGGGNKIVCAVVLCPFAMAVSLCFTVFPSLSVDIFMTIHSRGLKSIGWCNDADEQIYSAYEGPVHTMHANRGYEMAVTMCHVLKSSS